MNKNAAKFIKNFTYTLTSSLVSLFISTLAILIVPRLIGVEEYGYWQLYLFYSSYAGFLLFGWNDGIYLRYGGKWYRQLNKRLFFTQFNMVVFLQLVFLVVLFWISLMLTDKNSANIFQMVAISLFITNIRGILLSTMQATNRIKDYAQITMLDRILYASLISILLIINIREYKYLIVTDLIGKFISLLYAMYCCRDIVCHKFTTCYFSFKEAIENINVGIKLMFANIASMLIIGVVRFEIERSWDVATFGKVSLTLSISNLMMIFINAVGIIIFPILKRTDEKKLPDIYETIRNLLMVILLGILIVYYPLKVVLSAWLPNYADSLMYLALLFPMCVYEGKMALLISTYLKALRQEKLMLKINIASLILSVVISFISSIIFKNLNLAVISIVILLAFRCVLAEVFLSKILEISIHKDIILELMMTVVFILTGWYLTSLATVGGYAIAYGMYLLIKRKDITSAYKTVKLLVRA